MIPIPTENSGGRTGAGPQAPGAVPFSAGLGELGGSLGHGTHQTSGFIPYVMQRRMKGREEERTWKKSYLIPVQKYPL